MKFKTILLALFAVCLLTGCNLKSKEPGGGKAAGTVKDACGNTYNYVRIGDQYWMAENLRCNICDSQSPSAGAEIPEFYEGGDTGPFYIDGTNKSNWQSSTAGDLSSSQISHLGYQYNLAGYMALVDGDSYKKEIFGYQGICPNGWHIPTVSEFETLEKSVGSNPGKALKATSGWNQDSGNTDKYGFYALPAGNLDPTVEKITYVGSTTSFATATPMDYGYNIACVCFMGGGSGRMDYRRTAKYVSLSVRCVKN